MLYATTRNENEVCTAHKALHTPYAPDGGLYIPFRAETLDHRQLRELSQKSFCANVADILNLYFSTGLTEGDVAVAIGETPVLLTPVAPRVTCAECWHNPGGSLAHTVSTLMGALFASEADTPGSWGQIAVTVGVLFGIFGQVLKSDEYALEHPVDLAVVTGDFTVPMAAWFARRLGLPIGDILCGCNANGALWELLRYGTLDTGVSTLRTATSACDIAVPGNLERLVACTLDTQEARRFLHCCRERLEYALEPEQLQVLSEGLYTAVISDSRVEILLNSVYKNSAYLLGPYTALAYGCLMDHRAEARKSPNAIVLAERSPALDAASVARCTGLPLEAVQGLH